MDLPRFSRAAVVFMIAVPIAWAVVLLFHPAPEDPYYESLKDDATAMIVVHALTLPFIGLIGAALYLLVRDLPGTAARVSLFAIPVFVLFYGAGEATLGVATGVVVDHANGFPPDEQALAGEGAQAIWDGFVTATLFPGIGGIAWVVAAVAAALACRRAGAPLAVTVLLALSGFVALHGPPIGPIALLCFATAVFLLFRQQGAADTLAAPAPAEP